MASKAIRRGRATDAIFQQFKTAVYCVNPLSLGKTLDEGWEAKEVPIQEVIKEFQEDRRLKMITDNRGGCDGYLIRIPSHYAYVFYLIGIPVEKALPKRL